MSTLIIPAKLEHSGTDIANLSTRNQRKAQAMGLPSASAVIGMLDDAQGLFEGTSGTTITTFAPKHHEEKAI